MMIEVVEAGEIDGRVTAVDAIDSSTCAVCLKDIEGVETTVFCGYPLAKEIAKHFLGECLRVHGEGQYIRDQSGEWNTIYFKASWFEVLDDTPLEQVVKQLRAIKGADWSKFDAQKFREEYWGKVWV